MVEEEILVKLVGGGAYEEHWRGKGGRATSSLHKSLSDEHLQIIFEIRKNKEDQLHSQRILEQIMDILFDALGDALCGINAQHVAKSSSWPTTSMVSRAHPKISSSIFSIFFFSRRKLDGHGDQSQIILFIQFFLHGDASNSNFLMEEICFGLCFVEEQVANRWHCTNISRN
jgi:hypothetical protein